MSSTAATKRWWKRRWWEHHHATFMLAVFTRYNINFYTDRVVHRNTMGAGIDEWTAEDCAIAIEEGRRQLDGQTAQLQFLITRASALLSLSLAVAIFFATTLDDLEELQQPAKVFAYITLGVGTTAVIWGAALMGALIASRSYGQQTDATQLTHAGAGLAKYLARDYATMVGTGVNTNAARLTHLGTGTTAIVLGAILGVVGLIITHWGPSNTLVDTCSILAGCVTRTS